jgi:putative transposase
MPLRHRSQLVDQRFFFVTTSTKDHCPLFEDSILKAALLDIIIEVAKFHGIVLYGYVIMSNHFHLMVRVETGGSGLSQLMRDIKSFVWRRMFPGRPGIWESRFDDLAIYTEEQFRTKLNYIHNNPVKAGIVREASEYPFSSAHAWQTGESDGIVEIDI